MRYDILDEALIEHIDRQEPADQNDWLILTESTEFPGYWLVDGLDPDFLYDFEEVLGRYRIVSPARIDAFLEDAKNKGYHVVFAQDPVNLLTTYERLKETPTISLNSTLENNVNGFLPWQVIGFNKLIKSDLPAGLFIWDTGSGKTAAMAAAIKYHWPTLNAEEPFDLAIAVVKAHNKTDTQRKFKALGDIDSTVIDGEFVVKRQHKGEQIILPGPRAIAYEEISRKLKAREPVVIVTNYEKFRDDEGIFDDFVTKRRCLFLWDEAPTKLSNRDTQLYDAIKRMLYKSFVSKPRPSWMRHFVFTATPIQRDPDGLYSYLNLVRPRFLGTVAEFHGAHVTSRNHFSGKPELWTDLDKIEAKIEHMTHRVSKADPDVAKMFPEVMYDPVTIDWNPKHARVYDKFVAAAEKILKEEDSGVNILSMIQVLQMLCDAPSMVKESASHREEFWRIVENEDLPLPLGGPKGSEAATRLLGMVSVGELDDAGHTKLEAWREIIQLKHPDSKIVTHSTWASYIFPVWEYWLDQWGVSYVTYAGTDKQKQVSLDAFRSDPDIRVFLSGDAGADSIDIPQADVGVSYNGSWSWTTMKQREGRRDRVNSTFPTIYTYDLAMANSVEDRKREVRDRKKAYHDALFEGRALDSALSARLTVDDLRYMLLGEVAYD